MSDKLSTPADGGAEGRSPSTSAAPKTGAGLISRPGPAPPPSGVLVFLVLPLPPRDLSPNSRRSWQAKMSAKRGYREDCAWLSVPARLAHGPIAPPVEMRLTFSYPARRRRDVDNCLASFKAGLDGIVDSGLLQSDDSQSLRIAAVAVVQGPPGVRVELRSVEAGK